MIVFGPIPSRRLGRSLGINNIPPKVCSYSCIYCQVGKTDSMSVRRDKFFTTEEIYDQVAEKLSHLKKTGEKVDYLTFVPDGEPTLDINLGNTIERLKKFGLKIAVITNSSLLCEGDVRNDLLGADWVSVKIDSVYEDIWKKINRPHGTLILKNILEGIREFANVFKNELVTETMLVKGVNDFVESLYKTAQLISGIKPAKAFILTPTRPPAEKNVNPTSEEKLNDAFQIYSSMIPNVELITYYEGINFSYASNLSGELLSILSVHPMRKDAVEEFLFKAKSDWELIDDLVEKRLLVEVKYSNSIYYLRNLKKINEEEEVQNGN
ncbi:MAG TPA: radical SAM protein [Melioribacteraceae bacterium]|nr:radical SAM protein [Melioribacteraceae bacterium]